MPFDPAQLPSVFEIDIDAPKAVVAAPVEVAVAPAKPRGEGFALLGVPRQLVRVLTREGITEPFEIQTATLPDALKGRDVLGRGQTGSGKTLAFGLAVLARLAEGKPARPHNPRALILVPTRELAMQVADALRPLARAVDLFLGTAVGGVPYDRQIQGLQRGMDLLVATPGRLGDLIERGTCSLEEIEITVLDEADQMADMGFLPEVTQLLAQTPAGAQRLLFSATLDGDVDQLVKRFMTDPVTHSTAPAMASVTTMDHLLLLIPPQEKFKVAASIANREGRTIMFARTQMAVDRLVEQLREVGVRAGGLHGGKTQRVRTRTLEDFKEGRTPVLVATDVAARGIHVDNVSLVVHIDPPKDSKDYLHRAGRTARAGESGAVATLVLPKQRRSTLSMMLKAGVSAPGEHRVRLADPKLIELTGAREPSGTPVVDEPRREDRQRSGGGGFRGRRDGGQRDFAGRGSRREFGNGSAGGDRREGRGQGNRHEFGAGSGGARREFGAGAGSGGARREFGADGAKREFGNGSGGARREFSGSRREFGANGAGREWRGDAGRAASAGRRDRAS
ncbi:RNA helicase [Rhizocola hellebori]|uniref:RNA helicase n=1 Tax=Rhizocola hellebori TaxID=1392758 RepID=A0A8J3QEJ5_9ACTN|nr:DEAD/DEAH box helicase [Rhizocola hellebori]GIH09423.1 RNA helicase [Rhizocola hellebori]